MNNMIESLPTSQKSQRKKQVGIFLSPGLLPKSKDKTSARGHFIFKDING